MTDEKDPFQKYDRLFDEQDKKYHPEAYKKRKQQEKTTDPQESYQITPEQIKKFTRIFLMVIGVIAITSVFQNGGFSFTIGPILPIIIIVIIASNSIKKSKK